MLISLKQVQEALRIHLQKTQVRRADKAEKANPGLGVDRMSLSAESKELQALRQAVAQAPEVREDRVAELRQAIRTGNYSATGTEIAESMLARSLADKLL